MLPCRPCCGVTAKGIVFDGEGDALRVPNTDIRLFYKPESFIKRRIGVAAGFSCCCGGGSGECEESGWDGESACGLN